MHSHRRLSHLQTVDCAKVMRKWEKNTYGSCGSTSYMPCHMPLQYFEVALTITFNVKIVKCLKSEDSCHACYCLYSACPFCCERSDNPLSLTAIFTKHVCLCHFLNLKKSCYLIVLVVGEEGLFIFCKYLY